MNATATTTTHNNNNFKFIDVYKYKSQQRYSIDDAQLPSTMSTSATVSTVNNADANNYNQLIKSNSYCGTGVCISESDTIDAPAWDNKIQWPAASMIIDDNLQQQIATTMPTLQTQSSHTSMAGMGTHTNALASQSSGLANANADTDSTEYDAFLVNASGSTAMAGSSGSVSGTRRSQRNKLRASCCLRAHNCITRNWYFSYLVPVSILIALMLFAYLTRDYAKQLLFWIETQNSWIIFGIFMGLFTLVSFPIVVGYFVLLITAGYLFGCFRGWFTVILGANLGIAIAHCTIKSLRHRLPIQRLIKNETGRAILRVISGPRAFKVVLFTRLTPIPFGLQNAIFGISTINLRDYHVATFLGLLPAQTINVYLGSTLRSMQEVLNNDNAKLTGYISFVFEVIIGIVLMLWVVQKARKELSETLLTDIGAEGKPVDMQV